jgi:ABC-type branched-subunit amino acid transport system substrate-binding protein
MRVRVFALFLLILLAISLAAACGESQPQEVPVTVIVPQEVPQTVVVTQKEEVEVTKVVTEVVTEEVTKVVTEEVPVEVTKIVTEEVAMEQLPPLVVGNLNSFTGSLAEFGPPLRNSVALAADHVNAAGGIHGGSMVVISRDTAVSPVQGVDAARALIDVENAVAIVGALSSGVTIAAAEAVVIPNGRIIISGASTAPAITTLDDNDWVFRTAVSDAAQGVVLAELAWREGHETAGIMYVNNAYGEGLAGQFEKSYTELGGEVTNRVPHEDTQPTYTSELEKATDGDPDVLVTMSYTGQAQVYIREALEGGYADTFLFVDGVKGPEWIDAIDAWDDLEGTLGTVQGGPDRPEKDAFLSAYTAAYGFPPSHPFMGEHYDAAVLIALAAAKAGTTTDAAAIRDALRDVANAPGEVVGPGRDGIARAMRLIADGQDINYEGTAGKVDIDENGDVFGSIEIWQVSGGEIVSTGEYITP